MNRVTSEIEAIVEIVEAIDRLTDQMIRIGNGLEVIADLARRMSDDKDEGGAA